MLENLTNFNMMMNQERNMEGIRCDDIDNIDTLPAGEFCCAGILCGKLNKKTTFIGSQFIKHKCIDCNKAMHGGLCGSEALVFYKDRRCSPNAVVCFQCMNTYTKRNIEGKLICQYLPSTMLESNKSVKN